MHRPDTTHSSIAVGAPFSTQTQKRYRGGTWALAQRPKRQRGARVRGPPRPAVESAGRRWAEMASAVRGDGRAVRHSLCGTAPFRLVPRRSPAFLVLPRRSSPFLAVPRVHRNGCTGCAFHVPCRAGHSFISAGKAQCLRDCLARPLFT